MQETLVKTEAISAEIHSDFSGTHLLEAQYEEISVRFHRTFSEEIHKNM